MRGKRTHSGFTLVELSIALVIIAILIGAIATSTTLLHGAKLRSVLADSSRFQSDITTFRTKYNGLPGDMADATTLWGMAPSAGSPAASDAACAALTNASPSQGTRTCNGDNNGRISTGYEEYRTWQQLANAGMLQGNYTGVGANATAGTGWQAGINTPKSAFRDAAWRIFYLDSTTATLDNYALFYGTYESHYVSLWGGALTENDFTPAFTPSELAELDGKVDDGAPGTGNVLAPHGNAGGAKPYDDCTVTSGGAETAANGAAAALYNIPVKTRVCQPYIKVSF